MSEVTKIPVKFMFVSLKTKSNSLRCIGNISFTKELPYKAIVYKLDFDIFFVTSCCMENDRKGIPM